MTYRLLILAALAAILLMPSIGKACGLTPPIGPNGLPAICHGDEDAIRFRAGVTGGGTATTIDFGDTEADFMQTAVVGTFDAFPMEELGIGAVVGTSGLGHVDYQGLGYDLLPGIVAGVGASYRLLGRRGLPFIHTSLTLSLARAIARSPEGSESTFLSRDWRVGVALGKALGTVAAPFIVARYFGAGTDWSVAGGKGSDKFRYHVGVGSAFGLSERWDSLVEVAVLGEKRVTSGIGYFF